MGIGRWASTAVIVAAAWSGTTARAPAADAAPAGRTYHDVVREYTAYWRSALVGGYDRVGRRDPKWDGPARAFLDADARYQAYEAVDPFYRPDDLPTHEALADLASAARAAGCDDPMVLCRGARAVYLWAVDRADAGPGRQELWLLLPRVPQRFFRPVPAWGPIGQVGPYGPFRPARSGMPLGALELTMPAVEELLTSGYADFPVAVAARDAMAGGMIRGWDERLAGGVWERWLAACCEQPRPQLRRAVMVDASDTFKATGRRGAFVAALQQRAGRADPWVLDNLIGREHIALAWSSRGGGWAAEVTPEGWRGFHEHLATARDHFAAAWRLDPTLPQPAAEMITVAMGDGDALGERPLDWFARAQTAQSDFVSAFGIARTALLPRWGGSYEQMLGLAERGLAGPPRYDTLVPWQYVETVRAVGADAGGPPWAPLDDPAVYARVARLTGGYADALAGRRRALFRSYQAAAAMRVGQSADVRAAIGRLVADGQRADPAAFAYFGFPDPAVAASGAHVLASDGGEAILQAVDQARQGGAANAREALAAVTDARKPLAAADPRVPYLDQLAGELGRRSGEWRDLPLADRRWDWDPLKGQIGRDRWEKPGTPSVTVFSLQGSRGSPKVGLLVPPATEPGFGRRFEIEVTVQSFDGTESRRMGPERVAPPGQAVTAGVAFHEPESKATELAVVDMGRQRAGFAATVGGDSGSGGDETGGLNPGWDVKVGRTVAVRARCVGRTVTLFVDGKRVGDPHELPPAFDKPFRVGFGGLDHWYVEVTAIRYRLIPTGEDGPGEDDSAAPATRPAAAGPGGVR